MKQFQLRLFISGGRQTSRRALENVRELCSQLPAGVCDLEVVDLVEDVDRAEAEKVFATPTLIRILPLPTLRLVGDLRDRERLADLLEIGSTNPPAQLM